MNMGIWSFTGICGKHMGTFELEGVKIILGHLAFFSPNSAHQAKYVNI